MARRLDDPALQTRVLDLLRSGQGKFRTCELVGISPDILRRYRKDFPEFDRMVDDAIQDSVEPVLQAQRQKAIDGDTTAATLYLKYVAEPPRGDQQKVEHTHTHELVDPSTIESIAELEARIAARNEEVIDVEELPSESSRQPRPGQGLPELD